MELIGPYLASCALLVLAGVAKAVRPGDTARAIAGLPVPIARVGARQEGIDARRLRLLRSAVRVAAVAEAALGVVSIVEIGLITAALVAFSYVLFALFVLYARSAGGAVASCGCFGTPDTPATMTHAVINAGFAASAVVVAATAAPSASSSRSIISLLAGQPMDGVPLVVAAAVTAWLAYLALSVLGTLHAVRRQAGIVVGSRP